MIRPEQGARYSAVAMLLHWGIAVAIIGQLWLGFFMTGQPAGSPGQFASFQLHKSIGITILLLTVLRLSWRLGHRPPPMPASMARWERAVATATHHMLYLLMFLIPLSGWALVSSSPFNLPTVLYGVLPWPHIPGLQGLENQKALSDGFSEAHEILSLLMIALALLHVGGALRHHFLMGDDILTRMLPFAGKDRE